MDGGTDHGVPEVKAPDDDLASSAVEQEGAPAVTEASRHEEETSSAQLPDIGSLALSEDTREDSERPVSHEGAASFGLSDDDGNPGLHLEAPESELTPGPAQVEETREEEVAAASADPTQGEGVACDKEQVFQELLEEKEKLLRRNFFLRMQVAKYFRKNRSLAVQLAAGDALHPHEYEEALEKLGDLKKQFPIALAAAEKETERMRLQSKAKAAQVKKEWDDLMALKRNIGVKLLSRSMGKKKAQVRVDSILETEQRKHDKLREVRLTYMKRKTKAERLEEELRVVEQCKEPLHVLAAQQHAARLEQSRIADRNNEELIKHQKRISRNMELLEQVKVKLAKTQMEVEAKRGQLAELEAAIASKKQLRTSAKRKLRSLQKENQKLKESPLFMWNELLLQDYYETKDDCEQLERHLQDLQRQHAELLERKRDPTRQNTQES